MIEEIKKEIKKHTINISKYYIGETRVVPLNILNIILNEHKDEEDKYKNAWEELKKMTENDDDGSLTAHDFLWFLEQTMEGVEQKHNIEVKK